MADKIIVQEKQSLWLGYVIIAIALTALGAGAYLLYTQVAVPKLPDGKSGTGADAEKEKETPAEGIIAKAVEAVKSTVQQVTNSSVFPLHQGSRGPEVSKVQHYLNKRYNSKLVEDGIWGSATNKAIFSNASTNSVSKAEYDNMLSWLSREHSYLTGVKPETDQNV